jgi:hypothetical protein
MARLARLRHATEFDREDKCIGMIRWLAVGPVRPIDAAATGDRSIKEIS